MSSIRTAIPKTIRSPLGHVWRSCEAPFYYRRSQRILRDYSDHYKAARDAYRESSQSLSDFTISASSPGGKQGFISFSSHYSEDVKVVATSANELLSDAKECSFFPELPDGALCDRTHDISAVRDGEVIAIQLNNPLAVKGLEQLCAPLVEQLEQKLFGCHVVVDKVYVYRNPTSHQTPQGSWLWHYDNHPREIIKLMIYLTDVDQDGAPFQYLRSIETKEPLPGTVSPLYGTSRVTTSTIELHLANGFESHKVTGPQGTLILFDNNIIHKASLASKGHRDVLILQLRPTIKSLRPFIDPSWTGTFQHAPFSRNPADTRPNTKRLRHFS